MNPDQRQQLTKTIDLILIFLWGITLLAFPIIFTTLTTDIFIFPKEVLLMLVVLLSLLLWVVKMVVSEKVTFRRTPFDVPIGIFLLALLLSSLFSLNRIDSLIAVVPVIIAGFGFFIFINTIKKEQTIVFMTASLLVGGAAAAIIAIFSFFKVYPLFFSYTHVQSFSTLGGLLDQSFYFIALLPVAIMLTWPLFKGKTTNTTVSFGALSAILLAGIIVSLIQLFTNQKPVLLPFETGFQTTFAAISQDTGRIAQGFLLGSGFGNYATVFTRFKQAAFNANPTLWSIPFTNSSSFILEILATTGILGFLSFLFLLFRALSKPSSNITNPLYFALVILALISFIFPFSIIELVLLFLLLALFAAVAGLKNHTAYYDVELKFVALKKGFVSFQQVELPSQEKKEYNRPTAIAVSVVFLVIVGVLGWFGGHYVVSDIIFQKSLVLANANNGTGTYTDQIQAINIFPYRSVYYRIFSQTNVALAGSLASLQPKGSSPSAQTQNTMYTLIQQGITTGRQATTMSPLTVANWQNLASVYRSLIGLGQNADTFAIQASQQSVVLDPTNPQEYIALGGIYYQLGQWDNAIQSFQQAINLKQDYSNAYYNLGHAYEQKGDFQNAMAAYQAVKTLVANDKTNLATVNADIANLQAKMGNSGQQQTPVQTPQVTPNPTEVQQQPLHVNGEQQGPVGPTGAQNPTSTAPSPAPAQ